MRSGLMNRCLIGTITMPLVDLGYVYERGDATPKGRHRHIEHERREGAVMLYVVYGDVLASRDRRDRMAEIEHRIRIEGAISPGGRRSILRSAVARAAVHAGQIAMSVQGRLGRREERRAGPAPALTTAEPGVQLGTDDIARV